MCSLFSPVPREISALAAAGLLLASRTVRTRKLLGLVDWHLITLFCALFVVVGAFSAAGFPSDLLRGMERVGAPLTNTGVLGGLTVVLSNLVSNVPAVMLLAGHLPAGGPMPWYALALASTYAGNLFLIGSIANLIVVEQARLHDVNVSFRTHVAVGAPVTAGTLAIAWAWLTLVLPAIR